MDAFRVISAFLYKVLNSLFASGISLFTALLLGPSGRGFLTNTANYLSYYSPVLGSFGEYMPYGINKRKQNPQEVYSAALWFYLICSAILFLTAAIATKWLWQGFWGLNPLLTQGIWIVGLLAPFAMFHVYITRLVWGLNELRWLNRLNTVQTFAFLLLLVVVALVFHPNRDHRTLAVIGVWFGSYVAAALFSTYILLRVLKYRISFRARRSIVREAFQFGIKLALPNMLNALNSRIDVTLVSLFLGLSDTGIYGIAVTSAEMLSMISGSITQVVLTRMSTLDEKNSTLLTVRIFRHTMVVLCFSIIGLYVMMPYLMKLYGKDFHSAIGQFHILLIGNAFVSSAGVLISFFQNQLGKPHLQAVFQTISILTNATLCILLLPHLGATGSAVAKTIAYVLYFLATTCYFCHVTKYPFFRLFRLQPEEIGQYRNLLLLLRKRVVRMMS